MCLCNHAGHVMSKCKVLLRYTPKSAFKGSSSQLGNACLPLHVCLSVTADPGDHEHHRDNGLQWV